MNHLGQDDGRGPVRRSSGDEGLRHGEQGGVGRRGRQDLAVERSSCGGLAGARGSWVKGVGQCSCSQLPAHGINLTQYMNPSKHAVLAELNPPCHKACHSLPLSAIWYCQNPCTGLKGWCLSSDSYHHRVGMAH